MTAQEVIALLELKPQPQEGGYFRETYRSVDHIIREALPSHYTSGKHACTVIYYLLTPDTFSALHRLPTDEIYHHYLGGPVTMLQLGPDGGRVIRIGPDLSAGERPQVLAPRGVWQGSFLAGGDYALLGATVAPAFDFGDYEAGDRGKLTEQYPEHAEMIRRLTRS